MTGRERILAHLEGRPVDRLPVMPITMHFACDYIGTTYREYSTDYRVLVEGQSRTAEAFGFDYVNTMSDPAREAADCGASIEYFENQPAAIPEDRALLANKEYLARLSLPDPLGNGRMHNAVKAIQLFHEKLNRERWIEGWIEGPCAEAADLRGINTLMLDFFDDPPFVRDLFEFVLELELRFAKAQIDAGADAIGIGDAAASLAGPRIYEEFIWPYEQRMVAGVHALGAKVRLHICGNTRRILDGMGRLGCDIVDLDSLTPLDEARSQMGKDQVLLGNMNPVTVLRDSGVDDVRKTLALCHQQAGGRFIIGAGCEIPRDTPPANVQALSEYARTHLPSTA